MFLCFGFLDSLETTLRTEHPLRQRSSLKCGDWTPTLAVVVLFYLDMRPDVPLDYL